MCSKPNGSTGFVIHRSTLESEPQAQRENFHDFNLHRSEFMSPDPVTAAAGTPQQRFELILSQARFEGLKAILERVSSDREALYARILSTNTYEQLLVTLGH